MNVQVLSLETGMPLQELFREQVHGLLDSIRLVFPLSFGFGFTDCSYVDVSLASCVARLPRSYATLIGHDHFLAVCADVFLHQCCCLDCFFKVFQRFVRAHAVFSATLTVCQCVLRNRRCSEADALCQRCRVFPCRFSVNARLQHKVSFLAVMWRKVCLRIW